jgi:hypothetical protein
MEAHRTDPVCAGCHKVMDPIGFALENFDAVGQWRKTFEGAVIDPSGTMFDGTKIDGPASLRKALASRPETFVGAMTEKMMTYALGRGLEYYDMPAVRKIVADGKARGFKFSSLVSGVVNSPAFQMRKAMAKEAPAVAAVKSN